MASPLRPTGVPTALPVGRLAAERQAVLDELDLAMLFLGEARIEIGSPAPGSAGESGSNRHLTVRITPPGLLSAADTAALLCRVLHNLRIPAVHIERHSGELRLLCRYGPPVRTAVPARSPWGIELVAALSAHQP